MKVFCNAEDKIFMSLSFFAEKVILELNAQNHFFRASKNTNSVFLVQISKLMRMRWPQMLKNIFFSEKKC